MICGKSMGDVLICVGCDFIREKTIVEQTHCHVVLSFPALQNLPKEHALIIKSGNTQIYFKCGI